MLIMVMQFDFFMVAIYLKLDFVTTCVSLVIKSLITFFV